MGVRHPPEGHWLLGTGSFLAQDRVGPESAQDPPPTWLT